MGEITYEQLDIYTSVERKIDDSTNETTWLGCITNVSKWCMCEWEQTRNINGRILKGWEEL